MRERLPLYVLLGSALTFLTSLFLPWRETAPETPSGSGVNGILTLFQGGSVGGWVEVAGDVTVLLVVSIALMTVAGTAPTTSRSPAACRGPRCRTRVLRSRDSRRAAEADRRRGLHGAGRHAPHELDLRVLSRACQCRNRCAQRAPPAQGRAPPTTGDS